MSADLMATVLASTKRRPAVSGGKVGAPQTNLASVYVVPLLPVNPEIVNLYQIETPRESKVTYAFADSTTNVLPDIKEGDVLVVSSTEYICRSVAEWPRPEGGSYLEIVVEEQK